MAEVVAAVAIAVEVVAEAGIELPDCWLRRLTPRLWCPRGPLGGEPERWHMQVVVLV